MKKTLQRLGTAQVAMLLFLAFAVVGPVSAQTSDLPSAGSVPGSPFYFADRFFEGISIFFAFSNSAKATLYLALAEERLAEAQVLADQGDERAQEAVARYEEQITKAKERATKTGELDLEAQVTDATTKHLTALDSVLARVPEQAKASIQASKERSLQGQIESLRDIAQRDPERAIDIFARAAEGRLNAANARAESGGDDSEEEKDVEEALNEFGEYAEFGREISALAEGLQTGDTTVEELMERATSRYLEILQDVQSRVPAEAQESIERAINDASRVQNLRPSIPTRPQEQERGDASEPTGASNAPVDISQFIPSQGREGSNEGEEEEREIENETEIDAGGNPVNIPVTSGSQEGRP
ncbi:MAG: DUF5667 domain-containing protein [Candidatus Paceibacterota bacterium]